MFILRAVYRFLTRRRRERRAEAERQARIAAWQHAKLIARLEAARLWCREALDLR